MAGAPLALIKQLRERTQAPIGEVKAALEQAGGDLDEATRVLRTKVRPSRDVFDHANPIIYHVRDGGSIRRL